MLFEITISNERFCIKVETGVICHTINAFIVGGDELTEEYLMG